MRALRKEGMEIAPPPAPQEDLWTDCHSSYKAVKARPWFRSYTNPTSISMNCKVSKTSRKVKKLPLSNVQLKEVEEVGKAELTNDQLKYPKYCYQIID